MKSLLGMMKIIFLILLIALVGCSAEITEVETTEVKEVVAEEEIIVEELISEDFVEIGELI